MQAIQRNKTTANHTPTYAMPGDTRAARVGKSRRITGSPADDCLAYDKISKQMDDLVEGESPKRFKRPKMQSDIIAR